MTTKKELIERAEAMKAELKQMEQAINAMQDDKPVSPVFIPTYGRPEKYYYISGLGSTCPGVDIGTNSEMDRPTFRTKEAAQAYLEAFQTILELHVLSDWSGVGNAYVWCVARYLSEQHVKATVHSIPFSNHLFGRFANQQSAQAAIDKVGEDRILRAFDVLCGGKV